jgi:hypothetical protein
MKNILNQRSKILFMSACIGLFYIVYLIIHFYTGVTTTTVAKQIGASIATALVTPHIIIISLAVIFNWLGVFMKKNWAALVSAILYCVGGLVFILYILFVIPMIVLSFVGYAKQKKLNKDGVTAETKKWQYAATVIIILLSGIIYISAAQNSISSSNKATSSNSINSTLQSDIK